MKPVAFKPKRRLRLKAFCLCLYRRPVQVGFVPVGQASAAASPVFVVAVAALVAAAVATVALEPLAAAAPVVNALADPAHVSSAVAVADELDVAPVGFAPVLIHVSSVAVAAAAELHVVVAVAVALVLRRVRPAAVVVAPVLLAVQPELLLLHDPLDVARSAGVVAPARRVAVRAVHRLCHVATEPVAPVERPVDRTFVPFAAHHVRDVRPSPGTSVPWHDPAPDSRAYPWRDSAGMVALPVLCS